MKFMETLKYSLSISFGNIFMSLAVWIFWPNIDFIVSQCVGLAFITMNLKQNNQQELVFS